MSESAPMPVVLSRSTLLPVGVVAAAVAVILTSWSYFEDRFGGLQSQLNNNGHRLEKLEDRAGERWTFTEQQLWVSEFRRLNPEMRIPEARR